MLPSRLSVGYACGDRRALPCAVARGKGTALFLALPSAEPLAPPSRLRAGKGKARREARKGLGKERRGRALIFFLIICLSYLQALPAGGYGFLRKEAYSGGGV